MAVVVGDGNVEQPGGGHVPLALQPGSEQEKESRERRI
jgi:hypothetical protein